MRGLALVALGGVLATTVMAVAADKKPSQPAKRMSEPAVSIRDTGVGLPRIGAHGTLGAADFVPTIGAYHDSGSYAADLQSVGSEAEEFVVKQTSAVRSKAKRRCGRAKKTGAKGKQRANACAKPRLAVVLDIDETSLSNYTELAAQSFSGAGGALIIAVATADSPAIAPTLALYKRARGLGISVFAITGRPDSVEALTRQNLSLAGYTDLAGISFKPSGTSTIPYKAGERAKIEQQGFRIIANVGDQESDLSGGYADRSFKLPNPFYFIE
jgi:predicted secreted acid phosphatase